MPFCLLHGYYPPDLLATPARRHIEEDIVVIEDPVWVRAKTSAELRSSFKQVLKHTKYSPSEAIRLFMRKTIELGPKDVRQACVDVARNLGKSGKPGIPDRSCKSSNPGNSGNAGNAGIAGDSCNSGDSDTR